MGSKIVPDILRHDGVVDASFGKQETKHLALVFKPHSMLAERLETTFKVTTAHLIRYFMTAAKARSVTVRWSTSWYVCSSCGAAPQRIAVLLDRQIGTTEALKLAAVVRMGRDHHLPPLSDGYHHSWGILSVKDSSWSLCCKPTIINET